MDKKPPQKLMSKVVPKKVLEENAEALKSYDYYKKTSDYIERADVALGRKPAYKTGTGSTLNFEINEYGVASTTTQKIQDNTGLE